MANLPENFESGIRRAIVQAEVNNNAFRFIAFEVFLIAAAIGLYFYSLLVFLVALFSLFTILSIKKLLVLLIILFSALWGIIGHSIFSDMGFSAIAGGIVFFVIALLMHLPAIDGVDMYA